MKTQTEKIKRFNFYAWEASANTIYQPQLLHCSPQYLKKNPNCLALRSFQSSFSFYKWFVFSQRGIMYVPLSLTIPSEHLPQLSGQSNQSLSISSSPRFISRGFNSIAGILHGLIDEHQLLSGFTPQGFSKTFKNTTLRCCFQICLDCKFQLSYYFNLFSLDPFPQ